MSFALATCVVYAVISLLYPWHGEFLFLVSCDNTVFQIFFLFLLFVYFGRETSDTKSWTIFLSSWPDNIIPLCKVPKLFYIFLRFLYFILIPFSHFLPKELFQLSCLFFLLMYISYMWFCLCILKYIRGLVMF